MALFALILYIEYTDADFSQSCTADVRGLGEIGFCVVAGILKICAMFVYVL